MVKNGPSPAKTFYCTEKEESESELPSENLHNVLKDDIEMEILKIFLGTAYESLLMSGRREMEEKSQVAAIREEERRSFEKEVIKLMQLMNLAPLRNRESRLTGLDDDGKSWKLVRETVERGGRRFKCGQSAVKMMLNKASIRMRSDQEALEEESSSSSIRWGVAEAKDEVVSLGTKLSYAIIKITLLHVDKSEREKQLGLRNWIFENSFKKRSAVMYLFDFLLYKSEEFADCVVMEESGKDSPSEQSIPEEDIIGDDLLAGLARAICGLQLVAMSLSRPVLTKRELTAINSELLQCVKDVKFVEKTTGSLMKERSLKLKHKAKQSLPMKKRSETIFWAKVNAEMNKCWGESFWKYVEAARHLESVISSNQIVYALCKFFVFGFES